MSQLQIKVSETGADEVTKKLEQLEKEIEKLKKSTKKANEETNDQKKSFEELQKKTISATDNFQKVTSVAGAMGEGIGKVAGQLGTMKTAFEGATGIIAGPWGLAIGAGLAAMSAFKLLVSELEEEQKKLNRTWNDAAADITTLGQQIDERRQASIELRNAVRGLSGEDERRQALLGLQAREEQLLKEREDQRAFGLNRLWQVVDRYGSSIGGATARIREQTIAARELANVQDLQLTKWEKQREAIDELTTSYYEMRAAQAAISVVAGQVLQPTVDPTAFNADQRRQAEEAERERERRAAEAKRRRQEQEREELRQFQELTRQLVDFEQAADVERRRALEEQNLLLEEQLGLAGKIAEQKRLAAQEESLAFQTQVDTKFKLDEDYQKEQEKLAKGRAKQEQMVGNAMQTIQGLTMQSIELAKQEGVTRKEAFQSALDAWLKSFAIEQAFKGAENTINAIASYARYDIAAGTQFLTAAAGNFALAAAAGGASAAIPNVGGGAGAAPEERREATPENEGSRNVVINIQGTPIIDRATVGRTIQQAMADADRRY